MWHTILIITLFIIAVLMIANQQRLIKRRLEIQTKYTEELYDPNDKVKLTSMLTLTANLTGLFTFLVPTAILMLLQIQNESLLTVMIYTFVGLNVIFIISTFITFNILVSSVLMIHPSRMDEIYESYKYFPIPVYISVLFAMLILPLRGTFSFQIAAMVLISIVVLQCCMYFGIYGKKYLNHVNSLIQVIIFNIMLGSPYFMNVLLTLIITQGLWWALRLTTNI